MHVGKAEKCHRKCETEVNNNNHLSMSNFAMQSTICSLTTDSFPLYTQAIHVVLERLFKATMLAL